MYFRLLGVVIVLEISKYVNCISIEERIEKYFKSDAVSSFKEDWTKHMVSFESAIINTLQDTNAYGLLNVFQTSWGHPELLTHGFLISDNAVDVLCYDINITELPLLMRPDVKFALASNVLRLESSLSRILLETDYLLFRNSSEVLDHDVAQDPTKVSPFSFQQVQKTGHLAITAEDCTLIGTVIVILTGPAVSFGHDTLRLADCKFMVEISANGLGSPPVIAPFLSKDQSAELMRLMDKAFRYGALPMLQGVVFSLLNTTDLFETRLFKYRPPQQELFRATSEYLSDFVRRISHIIMDKNQGVLPLEDFAVAVDDKGKILNIKLTKMTLSGLDTIYSSNTGGAYKLKDLMLSEEINFNALYVKGKFLLENAGNPEKHDFAAELKDLSLDVVFTIENSKLKLSEKISFSEMRAMDYAIIQDFKQSSFRPTAHALISGYLTSRVPNVITQYLNKVLSEELGIATTEIQTLLLEDSVAGGGPSDPDNPQHANNPSAGGASDPNKTQDSLGLDSGPSVPEVDPSAGGPSDPGKTQKNLELDGGQSNPNNSQDNVDPKAGEKSDPDKAPKNLGSDGGSSELDNPQHDFPADGPSDPDNPKNNIGSLGGPITPDNPTFGGPSDPDNPQNNPGLVDGPSDPNNTIAGGPSDLGKPLNITSPVNGSSDPNNTSANGPSDPDEPKNNADPIADGPSDPSNPIAGGSSDPDNPKNITDPIAVGPSEPKNLQQEVDGGEKDELDSKLNDVDAKEPKKLQKKKLILKKSLIAGRLKKLLKKKYGTGALH